MSDLINRQDAIKAVQNAKLKLGKQTVMLVHDIMELPSAQQWIPCSERLPEDDTLMLVNYIDERPDAGDIWIGWHEMENVWYIDGEEHSREYGGEVIAWMPLPEPYKGGDNDDE